MLWEGGNEELFTNALKRRQVRLQHSWLGTVAVKGAAKGTVTFALPSSDSNPVINYCTLLLGPRKNY